jgi:hypothetical protein
MTVSGLTKVRASAQPLHSRYRGSIVPVGGSEAWPRHGALEDGELVTQCKGFEHLAWVLNARRRLLSMRASMAAIMRQADRKVNLDAAEGTGGKSALCFLRSRRPGSCSSSSPPIGLLWRSRRYLANATAVQLRRNPTRLYCGLRHLGEAGR